MSMTELQANKRVASINEGLNAPVWIHRVGYKARGRPNGKRFDLELYDMMGQPQITFYTASAYDAMVSGSILQP